MNKVKGTNRVKLFPNVWQVMFYENFTKNRANELFEDKRKFLEKSASNYFKTYESQYLKNVRKIEEYNNRLFNLSITQFVAEVETDEHVTIYPIVDVNNVIEFLKKQGIRTFPAKMDIPIQLFPQEKIKHEKQNYVKAVDSSIISITPFLINLLLAGTFKSLSVGDLLIATNKATKIFGLSNRKLKNREELYGTEIYWKIPGTTVRLVCRRAFNEPENIEPIVGFKQEDKSFLFPKVPKILEIPEKDFINSVNRELTTFEFDNEPLIENVNIDQRMRTAIEKRIKTKENKFERRKTLEIENLRKEIREAANTLLDFSIDPTTRLKAVRAKQNLEQRFNTRAAEIVKEDIRKFKAITSILGTNTLNQMNIKSKEMGKKKDIRAGEMLNFVQHLARVNEVQFKQKLNSISMDNPTYIYKVAYEIKEELANLATQLTSPMGDYSLVQRPLKREKIEIIMEDCVERAVKLYNDLVDFGYVKDI